MFFKKRDKNIDVRNHEHNQKLFDMIQKKIKVDSLRDFSNRPFPDEEIESHYAYPSEYKVKELHEQIRFFAKICHLDAENALKYSVNLPELPEGADGWFAFPKWQAWGNEDYYDLLIGIPYGMSHFRKRNFSYSSEEHLYQSQRTRRMFHQIYAKQEGDIIILPIQTGFFHSGRSVRRAREVFFDNEFGLDTLTTMLILKSHPERMEIGNDNNLSMCCAGDDFSMDGLRCFTFHASAISHCRSKNFFDALPLDSPRENYGAVTGFAL